MYNETMNSDFVCGTENPSQGSEAMAPSLSYVVLAGLEFAM